MIATFWTLCLLFAACNAVSAHSPGPAVAKLYNSVVSQLTCKYYPNILVDSHFYSLVNVAQWQTLVALKGTDADGNTTAAAVSYAGHYVLATYFRFELDTYLDSLLKQQLDSLNLSSQQRQLARLTANTVSSQLLRSRHTSGATFSKEGVKLPAASEVNFGEFSLTTPPQDFYAPQGPTGLFWTFQGLSARTFVIPAPETFRKASLCDLKPPEVPSDAFDKEYDIFFRLGRDNSTERTPDQTVAALFWGLTTKGSVCSFTQGWMDAAVAAIPDDYPLSKAVSVLLRASVAGHDATVMTMHLQYSFRNARPAQAMRQGDPRHPPVPGFNTLFPAGVHPDYPSGTALIAGALTGVLQALLPQVSPVVIPGKVATSLFGLPAIPSTRTFRSWTAAGDEAAASRLWLGAHYNKSAFDGLAAGRKVAQYVLQNWAEQPPTGLLPDEEVLTFFSNQVDRVGEAVPVKIVLPEY